MSVWDVPNTNPKRRPSLRGAVVTDVTRGAERVRAWPKARSKKQNDEQKQRNDHFRAVQWAGKYIAAEMLIDIMQARENMPLLPRDVTTMMLYNTLCYPSVPFGKRYYPEMARNQVSESLDTISQTQHMTLVRGEQFWEPILLPGGSGGWWYSTPPLTGWTEAHPGTLQLSYSGDSEVGLFIDGGTPTGSDELRIITRPISNKNSPWSLEYRIDPMIPNIQYSSIGMIVRDSISGRIQMHNFRSQGIEEVLDFSSLTNIVAGHYDVNWSDGNWPRFRKVFSDGTNITYQDSNDGKNYFTNYSASLTSYLTNKPDLIGFGVWYRRSSGPHSGGNVTRYISSGID